VDPATGAREVRLRIADPLPGAASGLTVSVNIVVDRKEAAISIPRSAILQPDGDPHVRTVAADGRVADRPIRFIDWPAASVIVTRGLDPGMRILADPKAAEPGALVRSQGGR
jgi:HlyD family secretion protein